MWCSAPNLWAIEWQIPKNAFANAIPAIVDAWAIFSLALTFVVPSLYAWGRYLNTNLIASKANPLVNSDAKTET